MSCEEYKRAIAADPAFEEKLAKAMLIDVPPLSMPALPSVEAENVVDMAARRPVRKSVWFAMAASVVLAAVIGVLTRFILGRYLASVFHLGATAPQMLDEAAPDEAAPGSGDG